MEKITREEINFSDQFELMTGHFIERAVFLISFAIIAGLRPDAQADEMIINITSVFSVGFIFHTYSQFLRDYSADPQPIVDSTKEKQEEQIKNEV